MDFIRSISFFSLLVLFTEAAYSFNWNIEPSLKIEQIYSDNITLSNLDKKGAFVTEVSPGISVNGTSSISTFDFSYRMQNLYNAQGGSGFDVNHQLQMNTNYEFVKDTLLMDSNSSISQQNISNRRTSADNISGSESSTTVSTFDLSPSWTPHFKNFADGNFRVTYARVNSSGGDSELSNTNSLLQNFRLTSGRDFSYLSWFLAFNNSHTENTNSDDVDFQDGTAQISYAIGREFSVFARAGYSNNSFSSTTDSNQNGISYTFGGRWEPSDRYSIEMGYGNNRFITVNVLPFRRLSWVTTYSNNDIGLNSGETWETALNYTTRRSVWRFSYNEDTITTQQLLLNQQIFTPDGFQDQDALRDSLLPSLTDEVFITKQANLSVSFNTGKTDIGVEIYRTLRTFEQSQRDEKVTGISGNLNWDFSRRSRLNIVSSWEETESDGENSFSDQRFDISLGVSRSIFTNLNGNIEYRYINQSSDDSLNTYSENRITANLTLQF